MRISGTEPSSETAQIFNQHELIKIVYFIFTFEFTVAVESVVNFQMSSLPF